MIRGYLLAEVDRAKIDPKHVCPECKNLLRDPVQTITCGHHYCQRCVQDIFGRGGTKCLVCGVELQRKETFLDKFSQREIQSLLLHCLNVDEGCEWTGELKDREAHELSCDFAEVECPQCDSLIRKPRLADHVAHECDRRQVECAYCGVRVLALEYEEHTKDQCPSALVKCPSKCHRQDLLRSQLAGHLDPVTGDCDQLVAPCPLAEAGCHETKVMKPKERKAHMNKAVVPHISILMALVLQLTKSSKAPANARPNGWSQPTQRMLDQIVSQVEGVVRENGDLRDKLRQITEHVKKSERSPGNDEQGRTVAVYNAGGGVDLNEVVRRVDLQETKTLDLELLLEEANKLVENLANQNARQESELRAANELVRRLERRLEAQDHVLSIRNVAMADLEQFVRQQQMSSYDGTLLWRITDFAKRKQDAISGNQPSFYSPCFYTSRQGYKMCARVYLNGDGMGRGTHISVFFTVMRGQFDALLRWPFRQKVTIMLLDQDNAEHVIDAFRPDPNSASFQRPRREMNVASGCPLFCGLAELNKHAYVRDDVMFMKIIVDTSDL